MSEKFELLSRLFKQVVGRSPKGAVVSSSEVRARMAELTTAISERLDMEIDPFHVPDPYLNFWRQFGGEKALIDKMTTLYAPDKLQTSLSHLLFGFHHAADRYFGIDHGWLDMEDPATMHAPSEKIQKENDDEDDDDDDEDDEYWDDFTDTLTDGLLEITTENLIRTLKRRVNLSDCKSKGFQSLLEKLENLYGRDDSEVKAAMQIYFGRGILVSYELEENAAMIGFDSDERELAFRKHFPEAE